MFLTYEDLSKLFPKFRGIQDNPIAFHTVTAFADLSQPRGVFIPLWDDSGDLQEAIHNGAVAAVWRDDREVPSYTPNHFPIFFTNDLLKGLKDMLTIYKEKQIMDKADLTDVTKFLFLDKELLNKKNETYDIAVMEENLNKMIELKKQERRG